MGIYKTITSETEAEFKDRGSKFIAYTYVVATKEDVEQKLVQLKELHPKSRHVCYAYLLLNDEYRANDDGEPSGSAGLPILNQIKSAEVENILVAVVRYFGGTKLGVSGLINAYKTAAQAAIEKAEIIETEEQEQLQIEFDYAHMEAVMSFVKKNDSEVVNNLYNEKCIFIIQIRKSQHDDFFKYFSKFEIDIEALS